MCCLLILSSCTDTTQWDITETGSSSETISLILADSLQTVSGQPDISLEAAQPSQYANWQFDEDSLYKDDINFENFENISESITVGDTTNITNINCSVTIDSIELFDDTRESGKHGLAIIYTVKNNSSQIVTFNGINENVTRFAMFGPNNTPLKAHYCLREDPTEDYPERISFKNAVLYTSSMSAMELPSGKSTSMFRIYDFAGTGEYNLYLNTDTSKDNIYDSAIDIKINIE
jgi:hypothetical protein